MMTFHILFIALFIYLLTGVSYLFMLAVAGRWGTLNKYTSHPEKLHIAVLIPSYKEDSIIVHTASHALKQSYPADRYDVTVIADSLLPETIKRLKSIPVNVVEVLLDKSMKAKSLNAAFNSLPTYDIALILDADNLMSEDCLEKINHAFHSGWKAVQCHRTAKNKNIPVAILDSLSEEMNNTIFRKGQRVIGLSSALIGSGMAFEFDTIKTIFALPIIQNNTGEDKEVDVQLVKRNIVVEYIEDAYIYDEKVQSSQVFEKQRTRWIATQVAHLKSFLRKDMLRLSGQRMYLHKVFQCLLLPRLLLMMVFFVLSLFMLADTWLDGNMIFPGYSYWLSVMGLYAATLLLAIPPSFYNKSTFYAFFTVPILALSMVRAILHIRQNRAAFLHTPKIYSGDKL
jgi:cellulose synthase/poly-beta-1,6-N-acetylglucosamine synthase-like glycosyltransferase